MQDEVGAGGHRLGEALDLLSRDEEHGAGLATFRSEVSRLQMSGHYAQPIGVVKKNDHGVFASAGPCASTDIIGSSCHFASPSRHDRIPVERPPQSQEPAAPACAPSAGPAVVERRSASPRYLQIARELTAAISSGRYPVGARLPTEFELCEHFAISRFTAREAVRVLSSAGLVTRRQRVGTVVIATPDEARYTHAASSVDDLFQYAQDTELRLIYIGKLALARDRAQQFGAKVGDEWTYAMGMRTESALAPGKGGRPICDAALPNPAPGKASTLKLRERKTAVYALIEREYKVNIQRVEQEPRASRSTPTMPPTSAASRLAGAARPAPLLRRPRPAARGRREHPPGRSFTYRMQLRK
jgi:DNA-binding GntR family transcriptional regulator